MRYVTIALSMLLGPVLSAHAQPNVGIGLSGVKIGINVSAYPDLVLVPGYPVYYDPQADWNYFFYDGLYWVYESDNWYASSWYNGPWKLVAPEDVPLFVLRVPVRYYRRPPAYFRSWRADAPPHWGEHWGRNWEARRGGWDRWDPRSAPPPAPLPSYQRQYSGDRYPRAAEQQRSIQTENYRYRPHEAVTRQYFQAPGRPSSSRAEPQRRSPVSPVAHGSPPQQRLPPNPQRQATQTRQLPPAQSVRQTQPRQQLPPTQRPQTGAQDRSQVGGTAPQDHGRDSGPGPKDQGRRNESAPDKSRQKQNDEHDPGPK
jgi:hypothetical protein